MKKWIKKGIASLLTGLMIITVIPVTNVQAISDAITATYQSAVGIDINKINFPDDAFREYISKNFDKNDPKDNKLSPSEIADIKRISISSNKNIKNLTGIEHFTALTYLDCDTTGITNLNVSNNIALNKLYCYNTGIENLDVSKNTSLSDLICFNTKITSLDVSQNMALTYLDCSNTPLAYLNIGENSNLRFLGISNLKTVELEMTEDTFDITKIFPDIGKNKITVTSGADYDSSTGVMSNYKAGNPIKYTYDCGTSSNGTKQEINVTINLKGYVGSIEISQNNFPDEAFRTYITTSFDKDGNKKLSQTEIADIKTIDVRDKSNIKDLTGIKYFTALERLDCSSTGIESLDVSKNMTLQYLYCTSTGIESLDVSKNKSLIDLYCSNNNYLKNLTVKGADALVNLICYDTNLKYLDVSENKQLTGLTCHLNSFAYLNIGSNDKLNTLYKPDTSTLSIEITTDTFDIAKTFLGIDRTKITDVKNASYDSNTGVMSNYQAGKLIEYTYNCGTSNNGEETIKVTLILTGYKDKSSIVIDDLSKTYDGKPIDILSKITQTGSNAAVNFKWEQKTNEATWKEISSIPENAGTYRVTVTVDADDNYQSASATKEFSISQATNGWISEPGIADWTYGETPNKPTSKAKFGTATYTYSHSKDGTFTSTIPTNAGTWYVKASIAETNNYKGLETVKEFKINKADAPTITLPSGLNGVYGNKLSTVVLPPNWTWVGGSQILKVQNSDYKARLEVDDSNYNYTIINGYNSEGHYVEKTLSVTVSQATNSWTKEPVINDWTYGETTNIPSATAKYGTVQYAYSNSENGPFIDAVPTNAGTWYVKASVPATDDYTGLDKVIKFEINKATPDYIVPQTLTATYGESLKDIILPKGFSWNEETLSVGNVGVNTFTATYIPDDNNYKTITDISVDVTVRKAENKQVEPLLLDNWTFGNTPSLASVEFKYGQPRLMYSNRVNGTYVEDVPTNAGTYYAKAVVDGTDNYSGVETVPVEFVIEQRDVEENNQLKIPEMNSHSDLNDLILKDGEKVLVEGIDYDITKVQNGNKVTVTIEFKGNYNGTVTKSYTVENSSSHNQGNQPTDSHKNTDVKTDDTSIIGAWSLFMVISMGFILCLRKRED